MASIAAAVAVKSSLAERRFIRGATRASFAAAPSSSVAASGDSFASSTANAADMRVPLKPSLKFQAPQSAWTGQGEILEEIGVGEIVFALNPYFRDGTRLRLGPEKEAKFSDQHVLNDAEVEVLELTEGFAKIRVCDDGNGLVEGWLRQRNLTRQKRTVGLRAHATAAAGQSSFVKRGATISNLMPSHEEETAERHASTAGFDRLMAINGVKAGLMSSPERKRMQVALAKQAGSIRRQLKRQRRLTFDPHSKLVQRWDGVTVLALLFTASVTPFEVCLLPPTRLAEMATDPLSWMNRAVDVVFCADIVLQCFLAYQEPPDRGGAWVHDNHKILARYAKTWMLLDVLTAVPIDVIIAAYEDGEAPVDDVDRSAAAGAAVVRIVRMLRLLKLARILRASRILRRWQSQLGISFALLALVKFAVLLIVTTHWLACIWVLVGRLNPAPDDAEPRRYADDAVETFGYNWLHKAGIDEAPPSDVYGVAVFIAFSTITGGANFHQPATPFEFYFMTAMSIVGSSVWAYVISNACGILATLNPNALHFRHMMDELNFFARDKHLPRPMTIKLREFLAQTAHVHRQSRYDQLLGCFSARLRADAALIWAKDTLMRVSYFRKGVVEDEFLASAALTLRSRVFCRTEYMPVESLLVLERGIASKNGRIVTKGACLGEDMVLASLTFRDLDPAIALTFVVQAACFEKKDLEMLLTEYPLARREVRSASFKLAFTRAVLQLARVLRRSHAMGLPISVLEAFVSIRQQKQRALLDHMRLREPTRKLLASNLIDLAERTETIATAGEASRELLAIQVRALDSKVDTIINALGIAPPAASAHGAPAPVATESAKAADGGGAANGSANGGWLQTLMGGSGATVNGPVAGAGVVPVNHRDASLVA